MKDQRKLWVRTHGPRNILIFSPTIEKWLKLIDRAGAEVSRELNTGWTGKSS